jgi:hypothetical protein
MANRQSYVGVGRGHSYESVDDFVDEFDAEESDILSDHDPDRFDRRQVNRALAKLATGSYEEALDEIHHPGIGRIPRRSSACREDSRVNLP